MVRMVIVAHQDGNHMLEVTILDLVMVLQLESVLEQPTEQCIILVRVPHIVVGEGAVILVMV